MPTGSWRVQYRGSIRLWADEIEVELRPKERAVLAALVLEQPRELDTGQIAALVWFPGPPTTAHKTVQNHIARIRRAAPGVIVTGTHGYALSPEVEIDPGVASDDAAFFADLPDSPQVAAGRRLRVAEQAATREAGLKAELVAGVTPSLVAKLRRLVDDEPFNEHRWFLLALSQVRAGDRRAALLSIHEARRVLADVGLEPDHRLRDLENRLVSGTETDSIHVTAIARAATTSRFHQHRGQPYVGREREIRALQKLWAETRQLEVPHLALLSGAAGMGKSRLADVLLQDLSSTEPSLVVMTTRNRSHGSNGYRPIVDTLRPPTVDHSPWANDRGQRFSILEDVADADLTPQLADNLREMLVGPTVWLIDDLQWSSAASIHMLASILEVQHGPLLVIATTRAADGPLGAAMSDLQRAIPSALHVLEPLTEPEVSQLLRDRGLATIGESPTLAQALHRRTGGLPLYVSEIARHSHLTGTRINVGETPAGLQDWVRHHIDRLPAPHRAVVQFAAVLGTEIDLAILARGVGRTTKSVGAACDALIEAGLLARHSSLRGQFDFAHDLTRDVVYGSVGLNQRQALHAAAAQALATEPDPDPASLARHYRLAGPTHRKSALRHTTDAARQAYAAGAWADATALFETCLELAAPLDRGELLVWIGRCRTHANQLDIASAALLEALDLARSNALPLVQAAATLSLVGRAGRGATTAFDDERHVILLREAADALRHAPSHIDQRQRAVLLSDVERELAFALLLFDAHDERTELLNSSLDRVRQLEPVDKRAFAAATLGHRFTKLAPNRIHERVADINTALSFSPADIGHEVSLNALIYAHEEALRLGDRDHAEAVLTRAEAVLERFDHAYWSWAAATWRVVGDMIDGRLAQAEERALDALSTRPDVAGAHACFGVHLANVRLFQGRSAEMLDLIEQTVAATPNVPAYRAVLALCSSEAGDAARATEHLEWFTSRAFRGLPYDTNRSLALACLAHAAADLGDVDAARQLLPMVEPYSEQWIVISCYGGGGATWGPGAHAAARLHALLGHTEADDLFRRALKIAQNSPHIVDRIAAHAGR